MTEVLLKRVEALERQVELLKAAIKETWSFADYKLPLSLELEVQRQPTLKNIDYNRKDFAVLLKYTLEAALQLLNESHAPIHYSEVVEKVKREHHSFLLKNWTRHELGDKANLNGKVRDLASEGWLIRVAKGMYFYGVKLKEKSGVVTEK